MRILQKKFFKNLKWRRNYDYFAISGAPLVLFVSEILAFKFYPIFRPLRGRGAPLPLMYRKSQSDSVKVDFGGGISIYNLQFKIVKIREGRC